MSFLFASLAWTTLVGFGQNAPEPRETWERVALLRVDEIVNLRETICGGDVHYHSDEGCWFGARSPHSFSVPDALIAETVVPAVSLLALHTTDAELRREAKAAVERITAPKSVIDPRLIELAEAWTFETARPALDQLGCWASSMPLHDLESALRDPSIAPPSLAVWRAVAALLADHPARLEMATRLANLQPAAGPSSQAYFFAIGSIATASSHEVDARLRQKLIAALDTNSDDAQVARMALASSSARPANAKTKYPPSSPELDPRRLLRERFDDIDPARRRSTWLAASILESGRVKEGELIDFELRYELRRRFEHAREPLDISASALALAWLGDDDSRIPIRDRFEAKDCSSRGYLALSLALLDDRGAIELLQDWSLTAPSPSKRIDAVLALALIGDKLIALRWVEALLAPQPQNVATLARGLAAIGDARAVQPLMSSITNEEFDTPTRIALLRALAAVCDPNALDRRVSNYFTGR